MATETKNVADRIMIVRLGIHQWYPRKHDKKITAEIAAIHGVDAERAGTFHKNLVSLETIRPLQQSCRKLREDVHGMTAPWEDGGLRALPAEMYFDFVEMMREDMQDIDRLADDYEREYTAELDRARVELNGMFNEDDYPAPHVMRARFSVDYDFKPVSNPDDVRVWGLGDDAAKEIEDTVRASITAQVEAAQWHVVKQVMERAQEFIEKVQKFDVQMSESQNEGKGLRLYDSSITNLRDVITLVLTGLNFSGDQEIETLCKQLKRALSGVNAGKLKVSPDVRKKSTAAVEKVLKKFEGVYGS
jgi:hypothetical protein